MINFNLRDDKTRKKMSSRRMAYFIEKYLPRKCFPTQPNELSFTNFCSFHPHFSRIHWQIIRNIIPRRIKGLVDLWDRSFPSSSESVKATLTLALRLQSYYKLFEFPSLPASPSFSSSLQIYSPPWNSWCGVDPEVCSGLFAFSA